MIRLLAAFNLLLLFFSSSFFMFSTGLRNVQNYLIIIYTFLMFFMLLVLKKISVRKDPWYFKLILIYTMVTIISSWINNNYRMGLHIIQLVIIIVSLSYILPSVLRGKYYKYIYFTVLFVHLPIIIFPLFTLEYPVPYSGIFRNPNSLGNLLATLIIFPLLTIYYNSRHYENERNVNELYYRKIVVGFNLLLILLLILLTFLTESRTGIISLLFVLVLFMYLLFRNTKIKSGKAKIAFATVISITGFLLIFHRFILNTINKFYHSLSQTDDIFTGRMDIWRQTIQDARLFGHGNTYFEDSFATGAHNTFIDILGIYGWVPFTVYLLLLLYMGRSFVRSVKNPNQSCNLESMFALLVFFSYLLLSMGETMTLKLSFMLIFTAYGLKLYNCSINPKGELR